MVRGPTGAPNEMLEHKKPSPGPDLFLKQSRLKFLNRFTLHRYRVAGTKVGIMVCTYIHEYVSPWKP